ncbi:MAG: YdcF family protein [Firmicutes bacterium]|nr:YdcF family protein [Bacillota bacterium]
MLYFIKFIYTTFFLPPGIFIVLLALLSFWLFKRERKAAIALAVITFSFYIFSTPFVGETLMRTLEARYQPPTTIKGDVIVMLGGGSTAGNPDLNGKGHLSGSAANRLLTTAKLQKKTDLPVIFTGGQVYSYSANESEIAKRQLISLGIPKNKIIIETESRNTTENAIYTNEILKEHDFNQPILVTSAFHMERSVRNFSNEGIDVTPYPTDYFADAKQAFSVNKFIPTSGGITNTSIVFKEYLGIAALFVLK